MSTDTYPINPALLAPVEQPKNPLVQISDEFVMPREVAVRLIVCNRITNATRKRCKRAMQTAVLSRAPILQEMKFVEVSRHEMLDETVVNYVQEKADRVYNLAQVGRTLDQGIAKLVAVLNYRQLLAKAKRIPAKRRQAQWAALHGMDMTKRNAAEQRVNVLDEMLDAVEIEIARRTKAPTL